MTSAPSAPILALRGLRKQYGERMILDDIDLDLQAGTICVLTGVNGSGKSTLLRILAGLETATLREARFDGQPMTLTPYPIELRKAIGYVHQHPVLFATSVSRNIAYGLTGRGLSRSVWQDKVDAAIAWAGVAHVRDISPDRLSGGERQRIALARAEILEPRLLLLDEPTSNLDGPAREQVLALIQSLARKGRSVLVVGHDRDIINLAGTSRLKLRDGTLLKR